MTDQLKALAINMKKSLKNLNPNWEAQKSILEMKHAAFQWRQMEWIGFYFELKCRQLLAEYLEFPGKYFGKTGFDAHGIIPWDLKAHSIYDKNHKPNSEIIINDSEALTAGMAQCGYIGLIVAIGEATFDDTGTLKAWHDQLKGGISDYEVKRVARKAPSRVRKSNFQVTKIQFIKLSTTTLAGTASFQKGFRNSNGTSRRAKVLLDLNDIKASEILDEIIF